ncbi:hypothetical protein F5B17DRAFT_325276 [Nemania serpens]|nr:hypothetical protein F5B17DRAFT_325276 [Nemania serpens]
MGVTLTTTRQYGALLTAFTAFIISFVASRFWRIICLVLHQCFSTDQPRDAIHAIHSQRQVRRRLQYIGIDQIPSRNRRGNMRNSASSPSSSWSFITFIVAWRAVQVIKEEPVLSHHSGYTPGRVLYCCIYRSWWHLISNHFFCL